MQQNPTPSKPPRVTRIARKAFSALDQFLHVEAASGIVLLVAALIALVWANSPFAHSYHALWETPVAFGVGRYAFDHALRFWINDGLMTVFFLVVGIEIRRELHDGSLSDVRQAMLPIAAAIGGVAVPALIYFAVNVRAGDVSGWAVPTATDIALAVGVLALLGRSVPGNVRVFLLTLAIADDIIAVLVIAFYYSSGLHYPGFALAAAGVVIVIAMQRLGVGSALAYVVPGMGIWLGLLVGGAHPTLAGVVLGLLTPVAPMQRLRVAQRELLSPVLRLERVLHPWVAYAIVPLFVLANAGVKFAALDLGSATAPWVLAGIVLALVVGKPLGVFGMSWLLVRLGVCRLPGGVSWQGIGLAALLAGVGFTMSVLIATLAFPDETTLGVAKFGVLLGSLISGGLGIAWGISRRLQ